ncbi:unnamed protein product [Adineta ricciae]|uniref:Uncharacterized protein n=1 Tax=Adineta ricciae TaxID=249248 RepID=A0A815Z2K3_ADIRI|nr:unnamed protein product [Adineta ricciae]
MSFRIDNNCVLYLLILMLCLNAIVINSIEIRVENRGAYVARVVARYQTSKNEEKVSNSGSLTSFQSKTVVIENNAKSIEIDIQMYVFFNTLRTILKTSNPCPQTRCFVVWGTIVKAEWNELCCQ